MARSMPAATRERPVILVVDDYEDTREMYAEALEGHGYVVAMAGCGEDAVLAACVNRPELVVMDLAMPGIDGFMAIRAIRALPELDSTYIMVVSGSADDATRQRAKNAGCDTFLAKPLLPETLVSRIGALLASGEAPRVTA